MKNYNKTDLLQGDSSVMKRVFELLENAATTKLLVSLSGDEGTGKQMAAKTIHYLSKRYKNNFVIADLKKLSLGSNKVNLLDGADGTCLLNLANKGTLVLTQLACMDEQTQQRFLTILQYKAFCATATSKPLPIDLKIVSIFDEALLQAVEKGAFREDLYYRLIGLSIEMPRLKDREDDVLLLADFFLQKICQQYHLSKINFSKKARQQLQSFPFLHNVSELKALVEMAALMNTSGVIHAEDLQSLYTNQQKSFNRNTVYIKTYLDEILGNCA